MYKLLLQKTREFDCASWATEWSDKSGLGIWLLKALLDLTMSSDANVDGIVSQSLDIRPAKHVAKATEQPAKAVKNKNEADLQENKLNNLIFTLKKIVG